MRSLPLPNFKVAAILEAAVQVLTDADFVLRLSGSADDIGAAEVTYLQEAAAQRLHLIPASTHVGLVSQAEMKALYKGTLVRKGSILRTVFYDALIMMPVHGICPACGQRTVSTLDHYLPKNLYPAYAVTPANLVANCSDCNKLKSVFVAATEGLQLIHPYFDVFDDEVWLRARVIQGNPPSLEFYVDSPASWSAAKCSRVREHFRVLQLDRLYIANGSRLISDVGHRMNKLLAAGGDSAVSAHLSEEAQTRMNPIGLPTIKNDWQIAAYTALSRSPYFCSYQHVAGYG